ncbi:MAG: DUF308 domain-containing protein [Oscillospiraceae bacterium]|nr:DUF308 domain-containing protein [Oscillospiraceae bacterium]
MHHKKYLPAFILSHKDWFIDNISSIAFPIVGVILILAAPYITAIAHYLIGGAMALSGIIILAHGIHHREYLEKDTYHMAVAIIMLICGAIVLARHDDCIELLGTMWGLYGIIFAVRDINELLYRFAHKKRKHTMLLLFETLFTLALSTLLLLHPGASHFTMHLRILGIEIILLALQPENTHTEHHEEDIHTA